MEFKDCTKFANENPVSYIATMDGGQPRVRAFLMWFADESGFYYHTGTTKNVYKQLKNNPRVEICFYHPGNDLMAKNMMRVTGEVEFLDNQSIRDRLLNERHFLKALMKSPNDTVLAIFRIPKGEAWFWSMDENMREAEVPRVRF
jgi:pyridoxamine 5'-phosphate oxidase